MMEDDVKKNKRKKRRSILTVAMLLGSCALYLILIGATVRTSQRYQTMVAAMEDYMSCQKNAMMVSEGSDYLTEQVQLYVMTQERQYMDNHLISKY